MTKLKESLTDEQKALIKKIYTNDIEMDTLTGKPKKSITLHYGYGDLINYIDSVLYVTEIALENDCIAENEALKVKFDVANVLRKTRQMLPFEVGDLLDELI